MPLSTRMLSSVLMVVSAVLLSAVPLSAQTAQPPSQNCADEFESAQRLRKEGKFRASSEKLIACSQPTCPMFIAKECTTIFSEVQASLPSVTVRATDRRGQLITDVAVYMDGEVLTKSLDGRAVPVDPGVHEFRFEPTGKAPQTVKVLVAEGEKNKIVSVDFSEPEAPESAAVPAKPLPGSAEAPPETKAGPPVLAYVIGGFGVAAVGAGVVFRVIADKDYDDLEKSCKPNCTSSQTDPVDLKYNLSIASFAVGSAAIVAGGILWLTHGSSKPSSTVGGFTVAPTPYGSGALATWRGAF